jgi:hypothetical protein
VMRLPYHERRGLLDEFGLNGRYWRTPEAFDDGAALRDAVCEHELEGVVSKAALGPLLAGERGWIKTRTVITGATSSSARARSRAAEHASWLEPWAAPPTAGAYGRVSSAIAAVRSRGRTSLSPLPGPDG